MKPLFAFLLFLSFAFSLSAQQNQPLINVHLRPGFSDFFTTEVRFVNFVSDRRLCDVQLQTLAEPVDNGATRYRYFFFGYGPFEGQNDTITWHSDPGENQSSIREKSLRAFKQGLLPYLLQTPLAEAIDYQFDPVHDHANTPDPWNRWTFNPALLVNGNGGFFRDENGLTGKISNKAGGMQVQPSFSAWRIGKKWRTSAGVGYHYLRNWQHTTVGTGDYFNDYRSFRYDASGVYAIAPHWSVGAAISGSNYTSDLSTNPLNLLSSVGLEYNMFSYDAYFRHRWLFGYTWSKEISRRYFFTNIQPLREHFLYTEYAKYGRWGFVQAGTSGRFDFNFAEWSRFSLSGNIITGINLGKNIYLTLAANVNYGNNNYQLAGLGGLPVVASNHVRSGNYDYNLGIAYYFGSGYRNIINPRLRTVL